MTFVREVEVTRYGPQKYARALAQKLGGRISDLVKNRLVSSFFFL